MNSHAVVGMKTADDKRELFEHLLQHRDQPVFRDLRCGSHDLPLRHLVDGIDVIKAFDSVPIALMHGIDAQISGGQHILPLVGSC
jgi:hypothetical protein